jgi:hypothetical protein
MVNLLVEPLRVKSGADVLSVTIAVRTFAVKGRVDIAGRDVPDGLQILISGTTMRGTRYASVAADGTFDFPRMAPGTYTVRVGQNGMPISVDLTAGGAFVEFGVLRGRAIFPPGDTPPDVVLSTTDGAATSFVRPDIRADGAFEAFLPHGKFRAHLAGYLPQYILTLTRQGKSDVIQDGGEFQFSSRDELELQVVFQSQPQARP